MLIVVQYVTEQVTTPKPVLMHDDVLFVMDETTMQEIVREDDNTSKQVTEICAFRLETTALNLDLRGSNVKRDFRVAWKR